eukprot:CAMPEP_0172508530 /NCGR_PEP_ID=MMETSP1066-20121228/212747_1 /TAXON_ID=671091 /ORGANISM="Coscinodiscus wailesii, Strain CCMP2513" /LENGTH=95 /DNA_ID=CAMNT_0013286543 /DNA_START=139 /DNA_END=423 /DNA_ORIENTATION=-
MAQTVDRSDNTAPPASAARSSYPRAIAPPRGTWAGADERLPTNKRQCVIHIICSGNAPFSSPSILKTGGNPLPTFPKVVATPPDSTAATRRGAET